MNTFVDYCYQSLLCVQVAGYTERGSSTARLVTATSYGAANVYVVPDSIERLSLDLHSFAFRIPFTV